MCYEGGIRSFVDHIHQKRQLEVLHPDVIYLKGQLNDSIAEVALQYNDSYNELILSFANNVNTPDGGTHEEGFKTALTRVFNDFGREKGYIKEKDDNLSGDGRARRPDSRHQREADGGAVRRTDKGEAGQYRDKGPCLQHRVRQAEGIF